MFQICCLIQHVARGSMCSLCTVCHASGRSRFSAELVSAILMLRAHLHVYMSTHVRVPHNQFQMSSLIFITSGLIIVTHSRTYVILTSLNLSCCLKQSHRFFLFNNFYGRLFLCDTGRVCRQYSKISVILYGGPHLKNSSN